MSNKFYIYSFYRFVEIKNLESIKVKIDKFISNKTVRGTILLANEGINGSLSASKTDLTDILKFIKNDLLKIRKLNIKINETDFLPFNKMKVRLKNEIVTLGKGYLDIKKNRGTPLSPMQWDKLLTDKKTKIIDVRNKFEIDIGRFKSALNPNTSSFRDFPDSIKQLKIDKNDKIGIYCTGGIRCEKASAYMKNQGFKNVVQLEGGIINYLDYKSKNKKENNSWVGECFVFDERVSIKKDLIKGSYDQCYGCRHPINSSDKKHPSFIKGVCCRFCINIKSIKKKNSSYMRQKQIDKAEKENKHHPFKKINLNNYYG